MADAARAELEALALDLEARQSAVDEVELVLLVVEVLEPAGLRRQHHRVDAERGHAERLPDLAEDARAEVVDRAVGEGHADIVGASLTRRPVGVESPLGARGYGAPSERCVRGMRLCRCGRSRARPHRGWDGAGERHAR